jgi:hypothetical protein
MVEKRRALTFTETAVLRESIRSVLTDPKMVVSAETRLRWEGALTACEMILGLPPTFQLQYYLA